MQTGYGMGSQSRNRRKPHCRRNRERLQFIGGQIYQLEKEWVDKIGRSADPEVGMVPRLLWPRGIELIGAWAKTMVSFA
jgi:hypothetical protein